MSRQLPDEHTICVCQVFGTARYAVTAHHIVHVAERAPDFLLCRRIGGQCQLVPDERVCRRQDGELMAPLPLRRTQRSGTGSGGTHVHRTFLRNDIVNDGTVRTSAFGDAA